MHVSRRQFICGAGAAAVAWSRPGHARQEASSERTGLFRHGVASGDPLTDRIILWTRVTPPSTRSATGPIDVRWQVAADERLTDVVSRGTAHASPERDFTVKIDAGGLRPGRTYFYAFDAGGDQSSVGQTKTLPGRGTRRVRLAQVSCSNYPTGYFNVYRCLANRPDLDAVVHLGDYIYEFGLGEYSDPSLARNVFPQGETITLQDYRTRYALYRSDDDLQEAHRLHPFIVVWDDHESANDSWSGGAANHGAGEGDWRVRQLAAYRAYLEWMPIRESAANDIRLYRRFAFGDLADLIMLDTRGLRDQQVRADDLAGLADPRRTLLGSAQEAWLFDTLRASNSAGTPWRILGQQVLFSPLTPPGMPTLKTDAWEGYPAARERVLDMLARDRIGDVTILTGDVHSSWAFDVARQPWSGYGRETGSGSMAVEIVTPAVSSPPMFSVPSQRELADVLRPRLPHLKLLEGESRGYVLLEIRPDRLQAEYYFVPTVTERTDHERKAASFICERGSSRLVAQ